MTKRQINMAMAMIQLASIERPRELLNGTDEDVKEVEKFITEMNEELKARLIEKD